MDTIRIEVQDKLETDIELIEYLDKHIDIRENLIYEMRKEKLHKQLITLAKDAIKNNKVEINSIDDLLVLIELDLLLA